MRRLLDFDHNLTVTKLKCILNKYMNIERLKITVSFGRWKTMHHHGIYLLLFGKRQ